jgi:hypothetical protein
MLSLDQCIDLCGLSEEEVALIAEHERVPEIVAAQLACQWLGSPQGVKKLQCVLLDRLEHARACGDCGKAVHIEQTLTHFTNAHRAELADRRAAR